MVFSNQTHQHAVDTRASVHGTACNQNACTKRVQSTRSELHADTKTSSGGKERRGHRSDRLEPHSRNGEGKKKKGGTHEEHCKQSMPTAKHRLEKGHISPRSFLYSSRFSERLGGAGLAPVDGLATADGAVETEMSKSILMSKSCAENMSSSLRCC